jgi:uncharacterized protein (DUF433 family)
MAALDWSQCPAVESIPGTVSGAWVFKGTRLPVATVIENLEDLSIDEVIEQFDVTREQVAAVLAFVAQSLRASDVPAGALILFDHGTPKGLAPAAVEEQHQFVLDGMREEFAIRRPIQTFRFQRLFDRIPFRVS